MRPVFLGGGEGFETLCFPKNAYYFSIYKGINNIEYNYSTEAETKWQVYSTPW